MSGITIREAVEDDAPGIRRLFARTFGTELSEAEWRWKFADDPDGWFGIVAESGGEIVGNYAGWGMRFRLGGEPQRIFSVGDVATDPGARGLGRGAYRAMAEAFYDAVGRRGVPFCFGFPNPRALAISHRLVGSSTLFPIREIVLPCAGATSGAAEFRAGKIRAGEIRSGEILSGDFVSESFDPLWAAAGAAIRDGAVRDRRRANWRFHARPSRYYRMVWREEAGIARSWAALSITGEKALVADFLAETWDGEELAALVRASAAEAARWGARELAFWESPGGPARDFLARLPGERRETGFPIIVRPSEGAAAVEAARHFGERVHLVPALYDVV